jgi:hypothetical protein
MAVRILYGEPGVQARAAIQGKHTMPSIIDPSRTAAVQLNPKEVARYSRHLIMPEVGMDGQRRLKATSLGLS